MYGKTLIDILDEIFDIFATKITDLNSNTSMLKGESPETRSLYNSR